MEKKKAKRVRKKAMSRDIGGLRVRKKMDYGSLA